MMIHDYDPNKTFECYKCGSICKHFYALKSHFYTAHNLLRAKNIECKICGKKISRAGLPDHMKRRHGPAEKFQCSICNHWIANYSRRNHMEKHKDEGTVCKICGKFFKSSRSISTHMKIVHSDKPKNFKCNICEKSFLRQLKLNEHVAAAHTREFLYTCRVPGCGKQFRAEGNWRMHEKRAHPEEYEKIFKPFYKRAPNEPTPDVEEALKNLWATNEVTEDFFEKF